MRVGVVGTGLQARRRLASLAGREDTQIVALAGLDSDSLSGLAQRFGARATRRWHEVAAADDVDAVLVASTPETHYEIVSTTIAHGKHVLCEKPMTRTSEQANALAEESKRAGVVLKCGFNHRYHPAVREVLALARDQALGRPLAVRGLYGIGGRSGLESEWRSDPARAAGGQLMEQGIHLVDIVLGMVGHIDAVIGHVDCLEFPIGPLEDFGTAVLIGDRFAASITSSLVQWLNTFSLEVQFEEGYATVQGLGGSYGNEVLTVGRRHEDAPFSEAKTYFRGADTSWDAEWADFAAALQGARHLIDPHAGAAAMGIVEAVYESTRTGCRVPVGGGQ